MTNTLPGDGERAMADRRLTDEELARMRAFAAKKGYERTPDDLLPDVSEESD